MNNIRNNTCTSQEKLLSVYLIYANGVRSLNLPIEWSKKSSATALNMSPCQYSGSKVATLLHKGANYCTLLCRLQELCILLLKFYLMYHCLIWSPASHAHCAQLSFWKVFTSQNFHQTLALVSSNDIAVICDFGCN